MDNRVSFHVSMPPKDCSFGRAIIAYPKLVRQDQPPSFLLGEEGEKGLDPECWL
jgi:hypothetical protein